MSEHVHMISRDAAPRAESLTILGTTHLSGHRASDSPVVDYTRLLPPPPPRALTRRALIIGLALVAGVALVTPYNDYVLGNSPLIGNHFPIGVVTLMAALVLLVNPLLQCFRKPRLAAGELVVIMSLLLVASAAPSSGLARYWEPLLIMPFNAARNESQRAIVQLMPRWLVPTTNADSSIVLQYVGGTLFSRGERIPVLAFLLPTFLWLIFIGAIFGGAIYLAAIFRKQWIHHERLSYPLATIPLELFAPPAPGKYYNEVWRSGVFWAGALIPIMIGTLNCLHLFWPGVPEIRLNFSAAGSFSEYPWNRLPGYLYSGRLYLSVIGICFFVPSQIALSLWLFLVINGLLRVVLTPYGIELEQSEPVRAMGIYFAYFAALVWLARGHLARVLAGAWRNAPREEGELASYRAMVGGWLICSAVAWIWLTAAGMQAWAAALLLLVGTVMTTLMARIVAETGLFYVNPNWWGCQFFDSLASSKLLTGASAYWTQIVARLFYADLRESPMPYAANVMRMTGREGDVPRQDRPHLLKWLFIALLLSTLVALAAHHGLSYTYGRGRMTDAHASDFVPASAIYDTARFVAAPTPSLGRAWTQFGIGALMVTMLMVGRALFVSWPFHPIGLLLMNAGPMHAFWFSIFIGWVIKQTLMRYGGAALFRRAKPFFIGLIVGEMLIAGGWMFLGLATNTPVEYWFFPR